jgi:peptide/nickel transport system substrate-binding protein
LAAGGLGAATAAALHAEDSTAVVAAPAFAPRTGVGASTKNTLFWSWPASPTGLDPDVHFNIPARETHMNVLELPLNYAVKPISDFQFAPDFSRLESGIIKDWKMPATPTKEWTFTFREGILSHVGNELTADTFLYKVKRALALKGSPSFFLNVIGIDKLEQVQKLGKYTVKISLNKISPLSVQLLANQALVIFDDIETQKHATGDDPWATKWMAGHLVGYGPWKIDSFNPGSQTVFSRHENYYGQKPSISKVVVKEIPSSANRLSLLLAGVIDTAVDLLPVELQQVKNTPTTRYDHWDSNLFDFIGINVRAEPFTKTAVKRAVSYAIPYNQILQTVYLGQARQLKSIFPAFYPCYDPKYWQYSYDPEKAKSMLAAAGLPNGFQTKIQIDANDAVAELTAIVTADGLAKAGVRAAIEKLPTGDFYSLFAQKKFAALWIVRDGPGTFDPSWPPTVWAESKGGANSGNYSNPEVDKLVVQLQAPAPMAERCTYADKIQQIIVQEDPIWFFIAAPGYNLGMGQNVKGAQWLLTGASRWQRVQKV